MAQHQGAAIGGLQMPKISYASTMIVEDHLKKLLTSTTNKPFKAADNKLLPKMKHSPFGDFPAEYLTTKKLTATKESVTNIAGDLGVHEMSIAAKGVSKYYHCLVLKCPNIHLIAILKKGEGLGGKTASLNKPKERPVP